MEKKINNILFLTGKDGVRMTFNVLFTHHSETFNKDYAAFFNVDNPDHLIVFSYDEEYNLQMVQTEEEMNELNLMLQKYDEEQAKKNN